MINNTNKHLKTNPTASITKGVNICVNNLLETNKSQKKQASNWKPQMLQHPTARTTEIKERKHSLSDQ